MLFFSYLDQKHAIKHEELIRAKDKDRLRFVKQFK